MNILSLSHVLLLGFDDPGMIEDAHEWCHLKECLHVSLSVVSGVHVEFCYPFSSLCHSLTTDTADPCAPGIRPS